MFDLKWYFQSDIFFNPVKFIKKLDLYNFLNNVIKQKNIYIQYKS